MAAALLSHITFFHDPRDLPDAVIDRVGRVDRLLQAAPRRCSTAWSIRCWTIRWSAAGPRCRRGTRRRATGALLAFRQGSGDEHAADRARERAGGAHVRAHVGARRRGRRHLHVGAAAGGDRRAHPAGQGRAGAADQARVMTRRLLVLGARRLRAARRRSRARGRGGHRQHPQRPGDNAGHAGSVGQPGHRRVRSRWHAAARRLPAARHLPRRRFDQGQRL